MCTVTISIADRCVGINAVYPQTLRLCKLYQVNKRADFSVRTGKQEIETEYREFLYTHPNEMTSEVLIESSVLLRKIAEKMLDYDTFLLHGAAIAVNDLGYMFVAKSGTGKTTHIQKWLKKVPDAYIVNGDKPFIISGNCVKVCGSPWCGKERLGCNEIVPLKSVIFMERSESNYIRQISFSEAFPLLLGQVHRPKEAEKIKKTIHLLMMLSKSISFYHFKCNNYKDECFETAYNTLIGNK